MVIFFFALVAIIVFSFVSMSSCKIALSLLVACINIYSVFSCSLATPVVKVITKDELTTGQECQYSQLYDNGSEKNVDEFQGDDVQIYNAKKGEIVAEDEAMRNISDIVFTNKEHNIFEFEIWKYKEEYYVYLTYNVNLRTPCYFYRYDRTNNKLVKLAKWYDKKLIGIAENG